MASHAVTEVRQHNSKNKLWVTHENQVYDITDFAGRHPGGLDWLLRNGGGDVTEIMQNKHHHHHSQAAYSILNKFHIGYLDDGVSKRKKGRKKEVNGVNGTIDKNKGWREDELVDWNKPLIWQVGNLGRYYMEWVHSPVDTRIRFFQSDVIEALCLCTWWMIPLVWVPVMFAFLYCSYLNFAKTGTEVLLSQFFGGLSVNMMWVPSFFLFGVLWWTFMEYVIHRWFFHLVPPPGSKSLIMFHFIIHGQHHKSPMDPYRLVFPPVPASIFAVIFWFSFTAVFPKATAQAMLGGVALGYIIYDLMHYYLHHGSPKSYYLQDLKKFHIKHHFVNQQMGFGISSKLWDYPFGTIIPTDDEGR